MKRFFSPTRLFWGNGSSDSLEGIFKGRKIMVVIGRGSIKKNGKFDEIVGKLKKNNEVVFFEGINENPLISEVLKLREFIKKEKVDVVVAIGGGSVLDCAKASVTVLNENNPEVSLKEKKVVENRNVVFVAIPTTCGTGSEVDQYALITDENGDKFSFFTENSFPDYAFLEPMLLDTLSYRWIAATAIDAFCHSLEGFFSIRSNDITDNLAISSMENILEFLPIVSEKKEESFEKLLLASSLGGMVIAHTGTNLIHAFGYYLTKVKKVPHSFANSSLLPFYIEYLEEISEEKVDFFMGFLTPEDNPGEYIVDFLKKLNLPAHLKEVELKEEEFDDFFEYGFSKPNIGSFFKKVEKKEIYDRLKEWFSRER